MSTIKVNTVTTRSGSTLTLGESGKTVQLATGASQSGFGRTGTVNWVTTKKTASFTAVSGEGYFCDTAAVGAFTLTLPSSPSAGDIVGLKDYNGNFAIANLTIGRNGSPINGGSGADVVISTAGASLLLVYVDATQGWVATQDDESTFAGDSYIVATGGTITTSPCGSDKIHTFTGPGTFTVCSISNVAANNLVSYVIVAGGGGTSNDRSGGGGAGGFREVKSPVTPGYTASPLDGYPNSPNRVTVTATGFPIVVGGGGTADTSPPFGDGGDGNNSSFGGITAAGGGGGARNNCEPAGVDGGSGGGAGSIAPHTARSGGAGNVPPTTPPQGNPGGNSQNTSPGYSTGGGGGAGGSGANASGAAAGDGGDGATSSITGTPVTRAGGGGGGSDVGGQGGAATGGGGAGASGPSSPANVAVAGTDNTGGGAGGTSGGGPGVTARTGGSGIVIIRYKFQR